MEKGPGIQRVSKGCGREETKQRIPQQDSIIGVLLLMMKLETEV